MSSGRTAPMLATCLTHGDEDIDVVVKLNGAMDFGVRGAIFETAASLMASRLGIECPTPYFVWLSPEFIEAVITQKPEFASKLRKSIGWNFGSKMLRDTTIWPTAATVPTTMLSDALKIFAFDGLTQNPDRRHDNPNLMTRGEKLCVIDHECAFSFLTSFLPPEEPWTMGPGDYMERHALRFGMRGRPLDWKHCLQALAQLDGKLFESIREDLPEEWDGADDVQKIEDHVREVVAKVDLFEIELQRRIA